ncbi:hypothetical protein ACIPSE_44770 [Streptomyces sp. NPDC090106]|uniref:hypothetical protein n=1 Tax=Streptomyces sp. NPDC090106 TaxID=3365946 RepID=UPI00381415BC
MTPVALRHEASSRFQSLRDHPLRQALAAHFLNGADTVAKFADTVAKFIAVHGRDTLNQVWTYPGLVPLSAETDGNCDTWQARFTPGLT